jgi:hypothetical protein
MIEIEYLHYTSVAKLKQINVSRKEFKPEGETTYRKAEPDTSSAIQGSTSNVGMRPFIELANSVADI